MRTNRNLYVALTIVLLIFGLILAFGGCGKNPGLTDPPTKNTPPETALSIPNHDLYMGTIITNRFSINGGDVGYHKDYISLFVGLAYITVEKLEIKMYRDSAFSVWALPYDNVVASLKRFSQYGGLGGASQTSEIMTDIYIPPKVTYYFEVKVSVSLADSRSFLSIKVDDLVLEEFKPGNPPKRDTAIFISLDTSPASYSVSGGTTNAPGPVLVVSATGQQDVEFRSMGFKFDGSNIYTLLKFTVWDGGEKIGEGVFAGFQKFTRVNFIRAFKIHGESYKFIRVYYDISPTGIGFPAKPGDTVAVNFDGDHPENTVGVGLVTADIIHPTSPSTNVSNIVIK
ncbi:MAG: hypothetical protein Q8R29_02010 [bacterium]|nr:hypothetical protein [bacterium]